MDRTLVKARRSNRRRQERNFSAWQRFSPDGVTCRYCKHSNETHLCTAGQPHFYRPATEAEKQDPMVVLYRHHLPDGGYVLVRRITVAKHAEIISAFCAACAEAAETPQVLCYLRTLATGEVVGIKTHTMPTAA